MYIAKRRGRIIGSSANVTLLSFACLKSDWMTLSGPDVVFENSQRMK